MLLNLVIPKADYLLTPGCFRLFLLSVLLVAYLYLCCPCGGNMKKSHFSAICLSMALLLGAPAMADNGPPQVSMVSLQVVQNADGTQSVITPKGDLAPLPGAGVQGNTAVIYMGAQGGFWYTDRTGQTVNLDAAVKALQARRASGQQAVQVPQYAPIPYYQEQPQQQVQQQPQQQVYQSQSGGSGSGAAAALGTAAAAGLGGHGHASA